MTGTPETYISIHHWHDGLLVLPRITEPPPYGDRATPRPDTDQVTDAYPVRYYPQPYSPRRIIIGLRHRAGWRFHVALYRYGGAWLSVGTV